jgi:hypothetical protein
LLPEIYRVCYLQSLSSFNPSKKQEFLDSNPSKKQEFLDRHRYTL